MTELSWPQVVIAYGRWLDDPDNWPMVQFLGETTNQWCDYTIKEGIWLNAHPTTWRIKPPARIKFRVIRDDSKDFLNAVKIQFWMPNNPQPPRIVPGHSLVTDWMEQP